jgi:integrase
MRGNIRQRAKGTWTIQVYLGEDSVTGKKRYLSRTVKGTKKEAELALAKLVQAAESGLDFDATRLTLEAFADRWLSNVQPRVRAKTHHRYAELFRIHIVPIIGKVRLDKLQPLHLERVYEEAFKKGLSAQTVLHVHRLLYTALRQAVAWQLLARNVAEAVTPPRPERKDIEALTKEGVLTLLDTVRGTELEVPAVLALGTGLRMGEVLGLRWKDVDLDERRARVVQTIQESPDGPIIVPPKTHRSRRIVLLPTFVAQSLKKHKASQAERRLACGAAWVDNDLIVERGDGQPMLTRVLSRRFSTAARRAGLELTFHGLRHGHASLMLAAGVNLKVVSERLGHSTIGITADLYTHVAEEVHRQAANSLDSWWQAALSQDD